MFGWELGRNGGWDEEFCGGFGMGCCLLLRKGWPRVGRLNDDGRVLLDIFFGSQRFMITGAGVHGRIDVNLNSFRTAVMKSSHLLEAPQCQYCMRGTTANLTLHETCIGQSSSRKGVANVYLNSGCSYNSRTCLFLCAFT